MIGVATPRRAAAVLLLAVCAALAASGYALSALRIDTDTAELLAKDLPFRQTMHRYRRQFPQNEPELVLVVEALTPERADATAGRLLHRLRGHPDRFAHAHAPRGGALFEQHGLLYESPDALAQLSTRMARVQPLLAILQNKPSLTGLFEALGRIRSTRQAETADVGPVMAALDRVFRAQLADRSAEISWQRLMRAPRDSPGIARRVIIAQPELDHARLLAGERAIQSVRAIAVDMGLADEGWPRLRITGKAALAHQEMNTLLHGMLVYGPVALLLVAVVLLIGFRSVSLLAATLLSLLVGLALTAGVAALAVGRLNLISIAFAMLYVGLGVDFAIHFGLRYRELHSAGQSRAQALTAARRHLTRPLALCTLTTSLGFLAFVPTSFAGVAELGIIAASGMCISLLVTLTVMPAALRLMPSARSRGTWEARLAERLRQWLPGYVPGGRPHWLVIAPHLHRRKVLALSAAAAVASLWLAPRGSFDSDPLNLRRADSEAVRTFRRLRADHAAGARTGAVVLAESPRQARRVAAELRRLQAVGQAVSVFDLIPEDQPKKLAQIEQLTLLLGAGLSLEPAALTFEPVEAQVRAIRRFRDALPEAPPTASAEAGMAAHRLRRTLATWLESVEKLDTSQRRARIADLHDRVLGTLPLALDRLSQSLRADRVTLDSLPRALRSRWIGPDGTYRVQVLPAGGLETAVSRRRFVDAVQAVAPQAGGSTVIQAEAGRAVVAAFRQATVYALLAIGFVVLVVMRDVRAVGIVLLPLMLGGAMTAAVMAVVNMPFNFANVIALPLLFGVGVDNGVHMVHRSRERHAPHGPLLATTTARAIWFSAWTTLCGFAGLALSPHPGTASMGRVLAMGLTLIVGCTLILLPALLQPVQSDPTEDVAPQNAQTDVD